MPRQRDEAGPLRADEAPFEHRCQEELAESDRAEWVELQRPDPPPAKVVPMRRNEVT